MTHEITIQLVSAWHDTSGIELAAALLAVAYLILAIFELISCWAAAFLSACLYIWVLFGARLYMESALNGFYALMAIYGFWQWRRGAQGGRVAVSRWSALRHVAALLAIVALSLISWRFLRHYTKAAWPFADSMVTWSSVFATFLVARKVYENWHWWLAIDAVGAYLYFTRHLYATMLLYGLYLILIVIGMREWRRGLTISRATA